jgi:tetratricopeptide (TPR) repeat protein
VLRIANFILCVALVSGAASAPGQESSSNPDAQSSKGTTEAPAISEQVLAAEAAIVKSDWKTAEEKLNTWVAANPNDARALFDAGYVADAQNRLDDATALYRRALIVNPQSFEAHLSLGLLLARENKFEDARPELAAATQINSVNAEPVLKARAWRALARIDRESDTGEASNDLLEALKLTPETPEDTLMAASLAEQAGKFDAAEAAYRRVLAADAKSANASAGLIHLLIARRQYPEAETQIRAALQLTPDDPALTAQLATVLAAQDKAEALPLLQKLHDAHPNDPAITRMLADMLAVAGDTAGSDRLYVSLLASAPDDIELLIGHGQNLVRELHYGAAYPVFDKATQLDPANPDGWSGLAFTASQTNRPSIALHALTMRSKYLPEVPSTYFIWATSYDALHDRERAISYYHQFLDSAAGKYPDQESEVRKRLILLNTK